LAFALSSFSLPVFANTLSLLALSQNSQWQKLLHLKPNNNNQSYITSAAFTLNKAEVNSPLAELQATIAAFSKPIKNTATVDEHPQCRFPARLLLIKKHLSPAVIGALPKINCPQYQHWRQEVDVSSVSVVFASGYMSNPASMYGHLFLKLNKAKTNTNSSNLLNASLNYGAIVPNAENPITYMIKGIFGGYDAGYSDQQFYKHQHNYGNVELRDLWDYQLALAPEDINLLVAHIWELLGNKFDYFFIDENCAFHIAKLLELVLTEPLINDESLWVLPSSVAKGLSQNIYQQKSLVSAVNFIPSSETVLHNNAQQQPNEHRVITQSLVNNNFNFDQVDYQQLTSSEKKSIVESLFQYLNVNQQKQPENTAFGQAKKQLMKERFSLPIGKSPTTIVQTKSAPHHSINPSKYSLGLASLDQGAQYLTAGFRLNYFDNLSFNNTKQPFANLEMIDIELVAIDSKLRIAKIDLIDIDSLYLPAIPWSNDNASAWSVRAGYEQRYNTCFDCGIFFAEGDIGKSLLLTNNTLFYAMVGGKVFSGDESDINISGKLGVISQFSDNIKLTFELQKVSDIDFSQPSQTLWYSEINYQLSHDWELRFLAKKQDSTVVELKVNYFWDF